MESAEPPSTANATPRVFISYARSDGEAFATALRERLEAAGIPLWQDRVGEEGGRDWWLQITEALDKVEFMVLIMTPRAMQSEMVRKEWRYARQRGVCVYPLKGAPDLNFASLPRWIRDSHFYDLGFDPKRLHKGPEWRKFLNDLNGHCQIPRVPFMVEDLPSVFVPRPAEFNALMDKLLDQKREEPVAITAALRGAGGYGKTTLAKALCHDEHVQQAFDDGILWVTLGEQPDNLIGRVIDLIEVLSGERPGFTGIDAAAARLAELLADRDILMVIDDVWDSAHLKPFMQGGKRCARLITTRNSHTLPVGVQKIDVDAMRSGEAKALLCAGLPSTRSESRAVAALARRLGEWALLLKLANGVLRERVANGQPFKDALAYVQKALDKRGLIAFDARNAEGRHDAVATTLNMSIEQLEPGEQARFGELAIFPEDVDIPLETVQKLWGATGGLDDFDSEELCASLFDLSLLLDFDLTTRCIRLHDVVRVYLQGEHRDKLPALHGQFLDAYQIKRWADLPVGEPYLWDHLAYHLVEAGRTDELVETVKDLRYLASKAFLRSAFAAETDLNAALRAAISLDEWSIKLKSGFANAAHILDQCGSLEEALSTLHSRLQHFGPSLGEPIQRFRRELPRPYLTPWHTLPDLPHPALIRTLVGHTSPVLGCSVCKTPHLLVSASEDSTLKVWDIRSGAEILTLSGHTAGVNACVVSPDDDFIVSASEDNTLKIWDAHTGDERLTLQGHTGGVKGCALSRAADFVVSASNDRTVRIWDTKTGAERLSLKGHSNAVNCCAVGPDFIVSGGSDTTVKVWDIASGTKRFTLTGHKGAVLDCAVSPDGETIVSASADHTLKVWDVRTRTERFTLTGHQSMVTRCAVSPAGDFIVSASNDKTLKLWDAHTGKYRATLSGHRAWANACAVGPAGDFVVSGAWDHTLKVWDVRQVLDSPPTRSGHSSWVNACAVSPTGDFAVSASNDKTLKIWDTATGAERLSLTGHSSRVTSCAVSASGEFLVSASFDKTLRVRDAHTGDRRHILKGHADRILDCAISPDDTFIVSASLDKTLKVWDAATGAERFTLTGHGGPVACCAVGPGFIVSGSYDQTLKIWESATGNERLTVADRTATVRRCAVDPAGSFVVCALNDGTLKLWDIQTGTLRLTFTRHAGDVRGCAINRAGNLVVSVCEDGSIKVWSAVDGCCLTTLHVDGPLNACAFHPDGEHLVAAGDRGVYFLRLVQ